MLNIDWDETKMEYSITKSERIAIYGGGTIGLSIARRLIDNGYKVVAIIDKNPDSVKNSPVPVFTAENFYTKNGDAFIFISLGNGLIHTSIARELINIGFMRILFQPHFLRSLAAKEMIKVWNTFFIGNHCVSIPSYSNIWNVSLNDYIIHEDGTGYVLVIVHKDYVRVSKWKSGDEITDNAYSSYLNVKDHSLYKYLDFSVSDFDVISFSSEQIDFYNSTLLHAPGDFYMNCAAIAIFDVKRMCFNIVDGWHRIKFMIDNGFTGLPLRVTIDDWGLFFREHEAQRLMNYCKGIDFLPFHVKHPAFTQLPVRERTPDKVFSMLYKELVNK